MPEAGRRRSGRRSTATAAGRSSAAASAAAPTAQPARRRSEIAVPVFGYKNHVGIDRRHGFIRTLRRHRRRARTTAASSARLLDPDNTASAVWADTAYRSAANVALLARRGLVPAAPAAQAARQADAAAHRPRQRHAGHGSGSRSSTSSPPRSAACAWSIRTVGLARATTKLGLANLAYNMTRLAWLQDRAAA